jgi:hypothetical protein
LLHAEHAGDHKSFSRLKEDVILRKSTVSLALSGLMLLFAAPFPAQAQHNAAAEKAAFEIFFGPAS